MSEINKERLMDLLWEDINVNIEAEGCAEQHIIWFLEGWNYGLRKIIKYILDNYD